MLPNIMSLNLIKNQVIKKRMSWYLVLQCSYSKYVLSTYTEA